MFTDVDECATNTHTCSVNQICVNAYGSFRCLDNVVYSSGESTSTFHHHLHHNHIILRNS